MSFAIFLLSQKVGKKETSHLFEKYCVELLVQQVVFVFVF